MKYLLIATILFIGCKKEPQTYQALFQGDVVTCKHFRTTQATMTIYAYEKRKHKGTVQIKIQNEMNGFTGTLIKPEKGEDFRFKDREFGLGVVKDGKIELTYVDYPNCGVIFKGEKR